MSEYETCVFIFEEDGDFEQCDFKLRGANLDEIVALEFAENWSWKRKTKKILVNGILVTCDTANEKT